MKYAKCLSMLVFVLVAALLTVSPAMASAQRTAFAGTSNFGGTLNAGEWTFLSCGNVLARGIVEVYPDFNTDSRVTGEETIVSNGNFTSAPSSELSLAGYLWGTCNSEITEGGEYFYHGVAPGSGGYEGLIGHWEAYRNGHSGPFTLSGWILEP